MESKNMTPSLSSRKRRSTVNSTLNSDTEPTPTKRRQTRSKRTKGKLLEDTTRINLDDADDPFDFGANSDLHPEPLKNINIEHSSFGEVKYTKSLPTSTDRYRNTERIAISRTPQLSTSAAPDNPMSLSMLSGGNIRMELSLNEMNNSDKRARKKLDQKNISKESGSIDEFQIENDDGNETLKRKKRSSVAMKSQSPKNAYQVAEIPKSAHAKNKPDYWPAVTVDTTKTLKEIEHYQVPELNLSEQLSIDHPKELNQLLQPGARVLALWGNEYYAAIVCGREALGRYYIHFTEDNLNRILPPTGVIPISSLQQGIKISYIDVVDNEEVGKVSELMSQPEINVDNPKNWVEGVFQLRELDEHLNPGEIKSIHWQKLFLTKEQAGQIFHSKKSNPIIKIDEENIINESRAARRSRSARASQGSGLETPPANAISITPKSFASPGRRRRRNTPKEVTSDEIISIENNKAKIKSSSIINKKEEVIPVLSMNVSGNDCSVSGHEKKDLVATKSNNTNSDTNSSEDHDHDKNIFTGLKFVLTSANRPNKKSEFNKREIRVKIEERGGIVVDDFSSLEPDESANFRLIADTFYRTHKYLLALSLSIPCVDYHWIEFCVTQNKQEPINNFLLPSGESTIEPGRIFLWQPKSNLFASKRVLVYSKYNSDDPKTFSFWDIWSPIMKNLGATVIGTESGQPFSKEATKVATMEEKIDFCSRSENKFDIFLADNDVETELVQAAERNFGALAVSSEWIIQAIVTGELPNVDSSERFKYDFA